MTEQQIQALAEEIMEYDGGSSLKLSTDGLVKIIRRHFCATASELPREWFEQLIKLWRTYAERISRRPPSVYSGEVNAAEERRLVECADELEAVLGELPSDELPAEEVRDLCGFIERLSFVRLEGVHNNDLTAIFEYWCGGYPSKEQGAVIVQEHFTAIRARATALIRQCAAQQSASEQELYAITPSAEVWCEMAAASEPPAESASAPQAAAVERPTHSEAFMLGWQFRGAVDLGQCGDSRDVSRIMLCDFWPENFRELARQIDGFKGRDFGIKQALDLIRAKLSASPPSPAPSAAQEREEKPEPDWKNLGEYCLSRIVGIMHDGSTLAKGLQYPDACLMASVYELCADQLTALTKKAMEPRPAAAE